MQAQSWAAHFARGRAVAPSSARRARRSALPERRLAEDPGASAASLGRQHWAELSREFRPPEAPVAPEPSRQAVPPDVPAAALPHRMAAVVSPHQTAAWDATARRRQEEAVAGAYAMVRRHRAALMKAVEEPRQAPLQVLLMARHAAAAPRTQEVETPVAVAEVVASDATAPPQEVAAMAGSGAMALPPAEAARDAQVERQPVGAAVAEAAPHAAVGAEVAAARVAAVLRQVEAAVPVVAEAAPRQEEEVPAARGAAPAAVPSAAASVFRRGRLRPAVAAPRPAARSVREKRGLRDASRSARSSQAAQDEVWSWRSRFLESLL